MNNQINLFENSSHIDSDVVQNSQIHEVISNGREVSNVISSTLYQSTNKVTISSLEIFHSNSINNVNFDQINATTMFSKDLTEKVDNFADDFFDTFDLEEDYKQGAEEEGKLFKESRATEILIHHSQKLEIESRNTEVIIQQKILQSRHSYIEGFESQEINFVCKKEFIILFEKEIKSVYDRLDLVCKEDFSLEDLKPLLESDESISKEDFSVLLEKTIQNAIQQGKITGKNNQPLTHEQVEALQTALKSIFENYFRAESQRPSSEKENKPQEQIKHPKIFNLEEHKINPLPTSQLEEQGSQKFTRIALKILISTEILLQRIITEKRKEEREEKLNEKMRLIIREEILATELKRENLNRQNVKSQVMISEIRRVERVFIRQSLVRH